MGSGYSRMKKQKKQMAEQLAKMQEEMQNTEVEGQAGNGLVKICLNGDREIKSLKIDPACVDAEDVEALEDLIVAAARDASSKLEANGPDLSALSGLMPGMSF